ncbi:ABC transporter ATP-binding protein [Desulfoluna limicola]|uniref:ABC transporter ATP-binding protein n=1 Tax=Desulfoluna limicola TaxID=2810562 RepID=A0ABM7PN89_9BACT|nr:ABC transporter ATP-binding protein [Desulfoluna limicola]BCS98563.1 ABC transporter ATP-binding protein [Desulfoluna limicola]
METPTLEVRNLVKHYADVEAVKGISFAIRPGTCFGLLGPNGAGKTTTIEVVEGILPETSGEILYKGTPRGESFTREAGIQLQNTELPMYLTVEETLDTFRNLYTRRAGREALIAACRLEEILKRDNRKISGGQKQRLLLAMALANDPDLIFLDEPTTGLDPQARRHLWEIVDTLKKEGKTVVLTTHYMDEAQTLCDEIAIMDHGRIIAMGETDALLAAHCKGSSILLPGTTREESFAALSTPWFRLPDGRISIQTEDTNRSLNELVAMGIDLSGIVVMPQTLEDLFLKLTGNALRT